MDPSFHFFKPYLHLFNILIRVPNDFERTKAARLAAAQNTIVGKLKAYFWQYSIFGLFVAMKACEWWFSNANDQQASLGAAASNGDQSVSKNLVQPPADVAGKSNKNLKGVCPVCKSKDLVRPTLLTTCGLAFCRPCITAFLNEHLRCPVTHLPAKVDTHLRRLFVKYE